MHNLYLHKSQPKQNNIKVSCDDFILVIGDFLLITFVY